MAFAATKNSDGNMANGRSGMIIKAVKLLIATIGLSLGSAAIAEDLVFAVTGKAGSVWYYDAEPFRSGFRAT